MKVLKASIKKNTHSFTKTPWPQNICHLFHSRKKTFFLNATGNRLIKIILTSDSKFSLVT